jgi:hypothetical protein
MPSLSGFPAVETGLGLAFLYFLLSTICSSINESIASVLGWRAKTLEDAIRSLLGDTKRSTGGARGGGGLTTELFDHSHLRALVRDPGARARRRRRPSYLSPDTFSMALVETLATRSVGPDAAAGGGSPWDHANDELFDQVTKGIAKLPPGDGRATLERLAAKANATVEAERRQAGSAWTKVEADVKKVAEFRRGAEKGFDDVMERASGWYKRKVHVMVAVLAALVVLGLNVDSVTVASRLWRDGPVRAAVAASATKAGDPDSAGNAAGKVDELRLPVGWGGSNSPKDLGDVVHRLPGWLISIAAISLGAPFWFDAMSRIARLRGSGVPERPRSLNDAAGTSKRS